MSRNNGYGLAAVSYMRRVVEDKTNELIEVAAQFEEADGVDADIVAKTRAAADPTTGYTAYEEKLRIAAAMFPGLKVGSINPLGCFLDWPVREEMRDGRTVYRR